MFRAISVVSFFLLQFGQKLTPKHLQDFFLINGGMKVLSDAHDKVPEASATKCIRPKQQRQNLGTALLMVSTYLSGNPWNEKVAFFDPTRWAPENPVTRCYDNE